MFPKAEDLSRYWSNILGRVDAITDVPETHWSPDDYFDPDPSAPDRTYARRGGFLSPVDFPPLDFGIAPNNLEATDTTQLLGLMVARQALDDAGYGSGSARAFDRNRVSVILGVTGTLELVIPLGARLGHPLWRKAMKAAGVADSTADSVVQSIADSYVPWQENSFPGLLGNVAAGRIANRLDLGGTNCVVDAACASSLAAVNLAMLELAAGRCDMALTGGLDTFNDIFMYMCFSKTPALSPTGDVRPFDAAGDGTILGEGLGVVVLKRLDDARRDGDRIYAVVRSVGTSSDGKGNAVYAPSATGQAKALRDAYQQAAVSPETVELVEAHGTGTKVGDATELSALNEVFREARAEGTWCALGSVKSQIGHTKAAAGAAGLIKAALALHHKVLPPTAKVANPIKEAASNAPLYVNTEPRPWIPHSGYARRAAVSAFGFGGSNFHCVLEEADATTESIDWDGDVQIVAFSAPTAAGLKSAVSSFPREDKWSDFRVAAAHTRAQFHSAEACRLLLVVDRSTDLPALLDKAAALPELRSGEAFASPADGIYLGFGKPAGGLAMLFPGQGSQYVGMLRELACRFPALTRALSDADRGAAESERVSDFVYPRVLFSETERTQAEKALRATDIAQPAIGSISIGLYELLAQFGVRPTATAGHSFGEIPALFAANRIDARSAHRLARLRGRLMAAAADGQGSMLAVMAPLGVVTSAVREHALDVVIANKNAPRQVVVSGPTEAIERAATVFGERRIATRRLAVSAAFHSRFVADARIPLFEALREIPIGSSEIAVYSNTTARRYPDNSDEARSLLANQLARSVDFVGMIESMFEAGARTFLEVGPGTVLTSLVDAILSGRGASAFSIDATRGQRSNVVDLAQTLARIAAIGYPVELARWDEGAESLASTVRKPSLTVKISGANLTPKSRHDKPPTFAAAAPVPMTAVSSRATEPKSELTSEPAQRSRTPERAQPTSMNQHNGSPTHSEQYAFPTITAASPAKPEPARAVLPSGGSSLLGQALRDAQENMLALQKLGEQTAQLHRQFLEGQEKAQRTFQMLLEQQHRLVNVSLGLAPPPPAPSAPSALEVLAARERVAVPPPPPPARSTPRSEPRPAPVPVHAVTAAATPPVRPPAATETALARVQKVLIEVVADKTGYPPEMLEPGMELDADLGIDSIKRVEILSAIQERLPDAPAVKPEHLGTLRTVGQIAEFLSDSRGAGPQSVATEFSSRDSGVLEVLRAIVAEKTGYPPEMLEPGMELDADLGIDSIKRVEILSAVQERLPEAPAVKPEHLGTLRTLGQIADFLGQNEPIAASSSGAAVIQGTSVGFINDTLIAIVSEKTGYPPDMLEPGMELDADLGIDSIKRVEILSALQELLPDAPTVKPEHLGTLRTLGAIVEFLSEPAATHEVVVGMEAGTAANGHSAAAVAEAPIHRAVSHGVGETQAAHAPSSSSTSDGGSHGTIRGFVLKEVPLADAANGDRFALRDGAEIWVYGDDGGLRSSVAARLSSLGYQPVEIRSGDLSGLTSPERLDGLVILAMDSGDDSSIKDTFRVLRAAASGLRSAGRAQNAVFVTVTRFEGAFGTQAFPSTADPATGALAGIAKTACHEWPEVACKAIDLDRAIESHDRAAHAIVDEMFRRGPLEVGRSTRGRITFELTPMDLEAVRHELPISRGDVVIITGGARGVTAEVAAALAEACQPTIILLGRSPEPVAEPEWLAPLQGEPELKRAILTRANGHATPRTIADEFDRVSANREILRTINRIERAGSRVVYRSVDVRDATAVRGVLSEIRAELGPIRGVVHGAGVLADRRIEDQTDEQFARVYDTKVGGLRAILDASDSDELAFLALFSSSTARFGRNGQVAYAAGNEVLNKWAQREAAGRVGCRVVAFNWGPWDGGMVTPSLKPVFEAEGIGLIPLREGAQFLVDELRRSGDGPVEIVVLGETADAAPALAKEKTQPAPSPTLTQVFERSIDVASMPVLRAHVLDGRPVVPVAVMLEWLAHGALHGNPGLLFCGLNDFRLLKGVIVRGEHPEVVRVLAGKAVRDGSLYRVPVELRGTLGDGREVPHARAEIVLADRYPDGAPSLPALDLAACPMTSAEIYERYLFHGPALRGIERVDGIGELGISVVASTAPSPPSWFSRPARQSWLADPLAIDCAFQALIIWTTEQLGSRSLPTCIGRYRQFRRAFPSGAVRIVAKVTHANANRAVADLEFLDADGSCIALMEDYDCVVDASLNQAFRRNEMVQATEG